MLTKIKNFYAKRKRREKIILWVFILVLLGIWYSELVKAGNHVSTQLVELSGKKSVAETVLSQKESIINSLENAKKNLDVTKTLPSKDFLKSVEEFAKASGISYEISSLSTVSLDKTKIHSVKLYAQKSDMEKLIIFEKSVHERSPYITMQEASFNSDDKGLITARYTLSSFEFITQN